MTERPILFNGEMVRAILDGRKTQTRRMVKFAFPPPNMPHPDMYLGVGCPLGQAGDRLWVRETFVQGWDIEPVTDRLMQFDDDGNELPKKTWYRATDSDIYWSDNDGWETNTPWKPSIHMPRSASRITLEITDVRIERLQSISEADAKAEGVEPAECCLAHYHGFSKLWQNVYGSESWEANPWVWVIEFRRIEK